MNAGWICASVALAVSSAALGASPVRLVYEAPTVCPPEREFRAAVTDRGGNFDDAEATRGRQVMVVSIRRRGDGFAGDFQVRNERDSTDKREVRGATCG